MASLLSRGVVAKLQAGDTEFSEAFILKVRGVLRLRRGMSLHPPSKGSGDRRAL